MAAQKFKSEVVNKKYPTKNILTTKRISERLVYFKNI